jgi:hypothetical protein
VGGAISNDTLFIPEVGGGSDPSVDACLFGSILRTTLLNVAKIYPTVVNEKSASFSGELSYGTSFVLTFNRRLNVGPTHKLDSSL